MKGLMSGEDYGNGQSCFMTKHGGSDILKISVKSTIEVPLR